MKGNAFGLFLRSGAHAPTGHPTCELDTLFSFADLQTWLGVRHWNENNPEACLTVGESVKQVPRWQTDAPGRAGPQLENLPDAARKRGMSYKVRARDVLNPFDRIKNPQNGVGVDPGGFNFQGHEIAHFFTGVKSSGFWSPEPAPERLAPGERDGEGQVRGGLNSQLL